MNWHAKSPQEPSPQENAVKCREHAGEGARSTLGDTEVRLSDKATKGKGDASKLGTS